MSRRAPRVARDEYEVTRLIHVRPVGDDHLISEYDAEGSVVPPDTARRDGRDLEWIWSASADDDCPACTARTCVQSVVLRGTSLLVLHDVGTTLD